MLIVWISENYNFLKRYEKKRLSKQFGAVIAITLGSFDMSLNPFKIIFKSSRFCVVQIYHGRN